MLAGLVAGCSPTPPEKPSPSAALSDTLDVAARLLAPKGLPGLREVRECAVNDELRPALGCPTVVPLRQAEELSPGRWRYTVAPHGRGRDLLVVQSVLGDRVGEWTVVARHVVRNAPATIDLSFEPGANGIHAGGFLLGPVARQKESHAFDVPAASVLQGGLALDPRVPADESAPVVFRIVAKTEGESKTLHEMVVTPGDRPPRWIDYAVPLEELSGETLTLQFTTSYARPESAAGQVAAPLWSRPIVMSPATRSGYNFIVVSLDTLRADHVGAYGASPEQTPVLDALAAAGVTFEAATTTYPSTAASHASLFTGVYPSAHQLFAPPRALSPKLPTLTQLLARAGYRTAAVTENGMIVARAGFLRGFDSYTEFKEAVATDTSGQIDKVLDVGTAWLAEHARERFFLFLHTYEVHDPHTPPSEFDRFSPPEGTADDLAELNAAYRGEILYADGQIQRLLDALEQLGLAESTVLIVTSDHGEAFGEHGIRGHGWALTQELMHIPMIMRAPGLLEGGRRVRQPVSLVDLAPTVLDIAGVEPPQGMQGRSLVGLLSEEEGTPGIPVYSELMLQPGRLVLAVRDGSWKWIFRSEDSDPEVFDLNEGEGTKQTDVPAEILARGRELRDRFAAETRASRAALSSGEANEIELDGRTKQQLRALGYID